MTAPTERPSLEQMIEACLVGSHLAAGAGIGTDWPTIAQHLRAAAETLRALVPRDMESAPRAGRYILTIAQAEGGEPYLSWHPVFSIHPDPKAVPWRYLGWLDDEAIVRAAVPELTP